MRYRRVLADDDLVLHTWHARFACGISPPSEGKLSALFTLTLATSHRGNPIDVGFNTSSWTFPRYPTPLDPGFRRNDGGCAKDPSRKRGCAALLAQYLVQPSRDLCDHRLLAQPDVDADDLGVGCVPRCGDCGVAVAEFFDEPRGVFTTGEAETRALERHAINTWNPPTNRR